VLEALGAIGDGRIELNEDGARVISSDGSRVYTVRYDQEKGAIGSTDNGSLYRGYYGYPIIAFLMLRGELPLWRELADALKGIPWRRLNEKYRRYWIVEKMVLEKLKERGFDEKAVKDYVKKVLGELKKLKLRRLELGQRTLF